MNKKNLELSILVGLIIAVFCGAFADASQRELSDKLLRLHIIANSDSDEDQALKLKVRDRVLSELHEDSKELSSLAEVRCYLTRNSDKIHSVVRDEIRKNGYDYPVSIKLVGMYFPTREYDTFSLPAGVYNAMRVKIGSGTGKNWWCVLFPPLCVSAASAEFDNAAEQAGLSEKEIELISSGKTVYRFKFKTIEIIEKIVEFLN